MQERSGQLYSHIFGSLAGIEDLLIPKSLVVVFGAVPENWKTTDPLHLATSSADSPEDKHNLIKAGWRM